MAPGVAAAGEFDGVRWLAATKAPVLPSMPFRDGMREVSRACPMAPRHLAYLRSSPTSVVHTLYTRDLAGAGVIGACSHAGPGCHKSLVSAAVAGACGS
jgi:hypothetical protein